MALDKKPDVEVVPEVDMPSHSINNVDDETDTDFHENLPNEVLQIKDITIVRPEQKKRSSVEFKTNKEKRHKNDENGLRAKLEKFDEHTDKKAVLERQMKEAKDSNKSKATSELPKEKGGRKVNEKQTSQSSTQSKQSDSIGSVIPVITISTTESDEEVLTKEEKKAKSVDKDQSKQKSAVKPRKAPDLKSLRRQSSVESITEQKPLSGAKNEEEGHKFQYSL